MAVHRIAHPDLPPTATDPSGDLMRGLVGELVVIEGDEAHHAVRVKRLGEGAAIELIDGTGRVAAAEIRSVEKIGKKGGWRLTALIDAVRTEPPIVPRVDLFTEPPKGAHLEQLIDQLSQLGAASWSPLECTLSEVDPREGKLERLARTATEASKQCGRAWWLEVGDKTPFADAIAADDARIVVCHWTGEPYEPSGHDRIRLLVGPVGDLTERELAAAREAGATIASLGPLVMRIETAAAAACAIVLDRERRFRQERNES